MTESPNRCRLCGQKHLACPIHGDMGCDGEALANDFCEQCIEERAARKGEIPE